jgi:hypothetical protein
MKAGSGGPASPGTAARKCFTKRKTHTKQPPALSFGEALPRRRPRSGRQTQLPRPRTGGRTPPLHFNEKKEEFFLLKKEKLHSLYYFMVVRFVPCFCGSWWFDQ